MLVRLGCAIGLLAIWQPATAAEPAPLKVVVATNTAGDRLEVPLDSGGRGSVEWREANGTVTLTARMECRGNDRSNCRVAVAWHASPDAAIEGARRGKRFLVYPNGWVEWIRDCPTDEGYMTCFHLLVDVGGQDAPPEGWGSSHSLLREEHSSDEQGTNPAEQDDR